MGLAPTQGAIHRVPLVEHIFYLVEDVLVILFSFKTSELFKQTLLLRGQIGGCDHFDNHMLVAACAAMYHGDTQALEAERAVTLRTCRNLEHSGVAIRCGNPHFVAQGSLCEANGQFVDDIVALAFEDRMRFDSEDDIEIAWGATARTDFTFTCDTHVDAIIHAGGDIDDHSAVVTHSTLATAFFARSSDDAPFAAAALTHRHIDKLSKDGLLHATNLPSSLTGGTTGR